jgi:hypothetical protein
MRTTVFTSIFILIFHFQFFAQNQKGQLEINLPLTPYTALTSSYYANFEYHHSTRHSSTLTLGHQGSALIFFMWSNAHYSGNRIDFGHRFYLNDNKYARFFVGVNSTFELSKLNIDDKPHLNISIDSLSTNGLSFGPEVNAGVKIVLFKRILVTPGIGFRYYFSTLNSNKFTNNPLYWAYDDWNNGRPNWQDNRKQVDLNGFRKGPTLIPYFNIGFVLKL